VVARHLRSDRLRRNGRLMITRHVLAGEHRGQHLAEVVLGHRPVAELRLQEPPGGRAPGILGQGGGRVRDRLVCPAGPQEEVSQVQSQRKVRRTGGHGGHETADHKIVVHVSPSPARDGRSRLRARRGRSRLDHFHPQGWVRPG
jgi:hypothetical protein